MGGWRGSLGARRVEMREMEQCGETEVETTDKKKAGGTKMGSKEKKKRCNERAEEEREGGKETRGEGSKRSFKRRLGSEGTTQASL